MTKTDDIHDRIRHVWELLQATSSSGADCTQIVTLGPRVCEETTCTLSTSTPKCEQSFRTAENVTSSLNTTFCHYHALYSIRYTILSGPLKETELPLAAHFGSQSCAGKVFQAGSHLDTFFLFQLISHLLSWLEWIFQCNPAVHHSLAMAYQSVGNSCFDFRTFFLFVALLFWQSIGKPQVPEHKGQLQTCTE